MRIQALDFVSYSQNAYRRNCFYFFYFYRMNSKTTNTLYSFMSMLLPCSSSFLLSKKQSSLIQLCHLHDKPLFEVQKVVQAVSLDDLVH